MCCRGQPGQKNEPVAVDIDLSSSNLSNLEKQKLYNTLCTFHDIFATADEPLGRTSVIQHEVKTTGSPIRQTMRRLPVALKDTVDKEVTKMLKEGVIRHSSSPWSSPLVMVKKKDGSWRVCVDYRKLNSMTHRDAYPLPRIDATLDSLGDCSLFTTLDLASGYWQVEVAEPDKEKTAFSTARGHFEFNVMPFGLTNAPATFQRLMECVLAGLSGEQCLIYLDDIIIFSSSFEEHLVRLVSVLQRLRQAGLKLKPAKCHFAMKQVVYLGHVISAEGIYPDPSKTAAVADYPAPKDAKQLKKFLGLANYYRRFVRHYATIAEPLHSILRGKPKHFHWDEQCDKAFNTLRNHLVTPPILTLPNFSIPFVLYTDASDVAVGGVLSQQQDGVERVIAYWSRQLKPAERKYSTIEREALAAVAAIKDFYPYLYGHRFTLITDHNPLTSLRNLNDFGGRLTRWSLFLQQFDFQFQYRRGTTHTNADSLSRRPPVLVTAINVSELLGDTTATRKAQDNDPQLKEVISVLEQNGRPPTSCTTGLQRCFLKDGVLCRRYTSCTTHLSHIQVVVPPSLYSIVLHNLHNQAGHLGVKRTTDMVKSRFYWPGYEFDIAEWVRTCQECQKRNPPAVKPRAPLGTLQATYPFERLTWDIMGPLPATDRGNRYILVVSDVFTKWVEAFPLQNTLSSTLATVLVDEVICRFGVPSYLHSDQAPNFCSEVIQSVCKLLGIQKTRTSAYHPQGNGQTERFNRTVEAMLAKMVQANQRDWDCYLPKVLFAYRTSIHETTGFTPYHLNFGHSPVLPIDVFLGRSSMGSSHATYPEFVQSLHKQLKQSVQLARDCVQQQHQRHKQLYDSRAIANRFNVGDCVWLYTPAVKPGRTKKLSSLWRGPYTVIDRCGPVDYRIQLIGSTQRLVVHRNRLKLCYGEPVPPIAPTASPTQAPTLLNLSEDPSVSGGYTTPPTADQNTCTSDARPQRNRRPPTRFGTYVSH